jgi:hypothetical protein
MSVETFDIVTYISLYIWISSVGKQLSNNFKYKIVLNSPMDNKTRTLQEGIIKIR